MAPKQLPRISVIDPIGPAIEQVGAILFRPFELGKWFVIGFCAWLAQLSQGGFNFNFNFPFGDSNHNANLPARLQDFFANNITLIIVLGLIAFILGTAILITCLWLSSRGRFMFLKCVAQNKAEVKIPWHKFRQQANSLFLFRLAAGVISILCIVLLTGTIVFLAILTDRSHVHISTAVIFALIFFSVIAVAPVAIAFALLFKFTKDFVVPIMYLRGCTCVAAWREFLPILSGRKAAFTLYILFQIVINIAIGTIILIIAIMTCCCAALILAIPYIGTVLMLPILIFQRAYSLYYLQQFGPQFDVFTTEIVID